ncbi:thiamine pyrophosphate-binding protein, partial [Phascolarctobacterium succinatutens]
MKQRLADYVADFLAAHGVTDVFSVVGGGAMHLNDALGHH